MWNACFAERASPHSIHVIFNGLTFLVDDPISFNNDAVTLQSKGNSNHQVLIQYAGAFSGSNGLTFGGTGAVMIDTSGMSDGDAGGPVNILVDQATISAPSVTINANGKGSAAGGYVQLSATDATISSPTFNVSVDARPAETQVRSTFSLTLCQ